MPDPTSMRSVEDAQAVILEHFAPLSTEIVPLEQALGRALATTVKADRDLPPFTNSAMDGFAVRATDVIAVKDGTVVLRVAGVVFAGNVATEAVASGTALRIMTGAPMPPAADLVIPFEDTDNRGLAPDHVRILRAGEPGANIRRAGEDVQQDAVAVAAYTVITPSAIGVLASVGAAEVEVFRRPKVAILATGDELVPITERPGPGQIRNSNGYANAAQVIEAGGEVLHLPLARDTKASVREQLERGRTWGADLFLSSGGVSVGDFDVVKEVIAELGALDFWRVRMKPGKPLAFGHVLGVPLLGLPGNPVSAMVTFELFGRPTLLKMRGQQQLMRPTITATVAEPIGGSERRQYLRVRLKPTDDGWSAQLTGNQESNMTRSMIEAHGLLVVPEGSSGIESGVALPVLVLRWPDRER